MNITSRKGAIFAAAAAATLGLVLAPTVAFAAPPAPAPTDADNGSAFPMFLVDADSELEIPETQTLEWNSVVSAVAKVYTDGTPPYDRFPVSPDATGVKLFVSAPGDEYNQAQWYGTSLGALDANKTNGLSYMPLNEFSDGLRAGDYNDVRTNGGTYSLGFVYTNENGNQITSKGGSWFTIQVTAGTGTWTYDSPDFASGPVAEAPVITTTALNPLTVGEAFTQTLEATGDTPITWTVDSGTLPAGLTLTNGVVSGTPTAAGNYSFTLKAANGTQPDDTQAFTGTVSDVPVAPIVEPNDTDNAATKKVIAAPEEGASSITVPTGAANANKQNLKVVLWPGAVNRAAVDTSATGDAVVSLAGLAAGTYKVAIAENDNTIVAWGTFDLTIAYPDQTQTVNLDATVTASDLWSLSGAPASVDFGDVRRNASSTKPMNGIKVVDDRNALSGWTLNAAWTPFASGTDEIPASALTIAAAAGAGSTLIPGITLGTGTQLAQSDAGVSTLEAGQLFDTTLTFTAPKDAKVGDYRSTLTLTLASK